MGTISPNLMQNQAVTRGWHFLESYKVKFKEKLKTVNRIRIKMLA